MALRHSVTSCPTGRIMAHYADRSPIGMARSVLLAHQTALAEAPWRCFGWKIWSMISAPVVITGRSSRR
jgi:hypothetical protein